jgi:hypothetical protein
MNIIYQNEDGTYYVKGEKYRSLDVKDLEKARKTLEAVNEWGWDIYNKGGTI